MSPVTRAAGRLALLALAVLLTAACTAPASRPTGTPGGPGASASPAVSALPSPVATQPDQAKPGGSSMEPAPPPAEGSVPPAVVDDARAALATIVGADAAAGAVVVSAQAVTWPDGSLGCPQPGMMYTQVITPGYQVVFEVDGVAYDMHASQRGSFSRCVPGLPAAS